LANSKLSDEEKSERLETVLIKRTNILNRAENKLKKLGKVIIQNRPIKYSLFYCDPLQIEKVSSILRRHNVIVSRFTAEESREERKLVLEEFEKGEIEALVAMKCLDEGVDVPATKYAYFLSSSVNSRQFIQRRGRILRKFPGKEKAVIFDFITIPPNEREISSYTRQILLRELRRFQEFSTYAINKYKSKKTILDIAKKYALLDEV